MTSLSLKQIVEKALAEIGVNPKLSQTPKGKARTTTWIAVENGFGIRHYPSGRHVYVVQTRMLPPSTRPIAAWWTPILAEA
jgi:hypothetical protein